MKYVVLEVADDIDMFVSDMRQVETHGAPFVPQGAKLVGVFKAPTKFCDNSDGHRGKKTEAGWTRGKKWGWWVCGKCKKPTKAWSSNLNAVLGSARNLLEENPIPKATPSGSTVQSESTTSTSQGTESPTASSVASGSPTDEPTLSDSGGDILAPLTTTSNLMRATTTTGPTSQDH